MLLDEPGVPGGVLGLDEQADRAAGGEDHLEQSLQREHRRLGAVALLDEGVLRRRQVRVPGPEVEPPQVVEVELGDHAAPGRGPVDPPVVHADQVPVPGEPDVALQPVGAVLDGPQVRAEGVLGQRVRRAAVGHDERSLVGHG